jgi:hypothetical protein
MYLGDAWFEYMPGDWLFQLLFGMVLLSPLGRCRDNILASPWLLPLKTLPIHHLASFHSIKNNLHKETKNSVISVRKRTTPTDDCHLSAMRPRDDN